MAEKGEAEAVVDSATGEDVEEAAGLEKDGDDAQCGHLKKRKDKKGKKKKKAAAAVDVVDGGDGPVREVHQLQKAMALLATGEKRLPRSAPRSDKEAEHRDYRFWSTQPVPSLGKCCRIFFLWSIHICSEGASNQTSEIFTVLTFRCLR